MGDGMEEGTLLDWLKKEGDSVKSGEILGNIQTDKATLELEAPGSGTLAGILVQAGETVPVGRPIAALLKEGEKLPKSWGSSQSTSSTKDLPPSEAKADSLEVVTSQSTSLSPEPAKQKQERIKASPLAKKIATEKEIDLRSIQGTGPGGRIVQDDVLKAVEISGPRTSTQTITHGNTVLEAEDRIKPLSRLKKITGERTQQAKAQAPHIYVTVEVDVEKISAIRQMFAEESEPKPSINDFVIKACAKALRDMPEANSSLTTEGILIHGQVNIGIAAAIEDGLTVPVIKNADHLTLRQISSASKDLVKKAKDNKLSLTELSGSTFSISNMGMLDIDNFCAIVNVPNAAILAVSSARKKAVVNEDDEIEIRERMNITGSFDHRLLDGAEAAKFMNIVKGYLQSPTKLLS